MLLEGREALQRFIEEKAIKYFKPEEFLCKHCGRVKIESRIVEILEELRRSLKKPLIITSAYRCPVHNRRIGGVRNSAHTKGYAVDIRCGNGEDRQRIVEFLLKKGVKRIGIHRNFIHFDLDPKKPSPRLWIYGRKRHLA
ncbi:MAG: peptidase M15 [Aquificae bacterium]|nr:peptidase M15 [Aquificota bacterium]